MKGSASAPSSATMNGTRWATREATNATSRESRSSLATITGQRFARPVANAEASSGAAIDRIRTLAGLHFDELGRESEPFPFGEAGYGRTLGLDAEPRSA